MLLLRNIQGRISSAIVGAIAAVFFLICGAILAFVISPQQALEWRRIENLPELTASSYAAVATGDEVAVTGTLQENQTLTEDGMVAYTRDEWNVDTPDPAEEEQTTPSGSWSTIERQAPPLNLEISGGTVKTLSASSPTFSGNLHETLEQGTGAEKADYEGQQLPGGSLRTRGIKNGDLVTVVGRKGSTGDISPDRLFGGDRVQLVDNLRSGARALFASGIGLMICSPIVLVIGVLAGLFGRRRRSIL